MWPDDKVLNSKQNNTIIKRQNQVINLKKNKRKFQAWRNFKIHKLEGKRLSVLKELYYGNINPHEKRVISNLEFEKHVKVILENEEKLSKTLKNEEK